MPPQGPYAPRRATPSSLVAWILVVVVPLAMLLVLRLAPPIDEKWENHPAHFWLVLGAASIATTLGYVVSVAARSRRDARLFLISLAFISSAGFLGLHALATPGVLLGQERRLRAGNAGRSAVRRRSGGPSRDSTSPPATSRRIIAYSPWLLAICLALIALWGAVSLAGVGPLNQPLQEEELNGWQTVLGAAGVAFYALGGLGYYRLYRKRGARFALRGRRRVHVVGRGDGGRRVRAELGGLLVGVARADDLGIRADRAESPGGSGTRSASARSIWTRPSQAPARRASCSLTCSSSPPTRSGPIRPTSRRCSTRTSDSWCRCWPRWAARSIS